MNYVMGIVSFIPAFYHAGKALSLKHASLLKGEERSVKELSCMREYCSMNGIRQDVKLIETTDTIFPEALGSNTGKHAAIRVHQVMLNLEPAGYRYLVRAELFKIKHDIPLKDNLLRAVGTLFTAVFCLVEATETGVILPGMALLGMENIVEYMYLRPREDEARKSALIASTRKELKGALHIFEAMRKVGDRNTLSYEGKVVEDELTQRGIRVSFDVNKIAALVTTIKSVSSRVF